MLPTHFVNLQSERNLPRLRNRRHYSSTLTSENTSSLTTSSDENEAEMSQQLSETIKNVDYQRKTNTSRSRMESDSQRNLSPGKSVVVPQVTKNFKSNGLLQVAPQLAKSPHSSQTRLSVNRRSLREITNEDWRKSVSI